MERIASFSIDHTKLKKGMYVSRTDFGDIVTYDIRMKEPNGGDYLSNGAAHTFEHLFATYARNSDYKDHIVYVGPMGCMTGCYLVTKALSNDEALNLVCGALVFIRDFSGAIPGASEAECGNYRLHNLADAQAVAADMIAVLSDWDESKMHYTAYLNGEKKNFTY